jgi:hypothetical protein
MQAFRFRLTDEQRTQIKAITDDARAPGHKPGPDGSIGRLEWVIDSWMDAKEDISQRRFNKLTANDPHFSRKQANTFGTAQKEVNKAISALQKIQEMGITVDVPVSVTGTVIKPDIDGAGWVDPLELLNALEGIYTTAHEREALKDPCPGKKLPRATKEPLINLVLWWKQATGSFPSYSNAGDTSDTSYGRFGDFLKVLDDEQNIPILDDFFRRSQSALVAAIKEAKQR